LKFCLGLLFHPPSPVCIYDHETLITLTELRYQLTEAIFRKRDLIKLPKTDHNNWLITLNVTSLTVTYYSFKYLLFKRSNKFEMLCVSCFTLQQ
jgi:hypothetical protein